MGWVKRKVDEHVCQKPKYNKDVAVGDIWKCDECNLQYKVSKVYPQQWDQRENSYWGGSLDWQIYVSPQQGGWYKDR